MTYFDYPACLRDYAWLLEGDVSKLFTQTAYPFCKACGDPCSRQDQAKHKQMHIDQLGPKKEKVKWDELEAIQKVIDEMPVTFDNRVLDTIVDLQERVQEEPRKLWL